jgi:type I restriction enzyme, S subunit
MSDFSLVLDEAPFNWKDYELSEICTQIRESYQPIVGGDKLYLGLADMAQGFPVLISRGDESDVKSNKSKFYANDVLFGKLRPYLRKSVLMKEEGICSTDILVLRVSENLLPDYLVYLMHSDYLINHAKATTTGVQHPRTSWKALSTFRIKLPPLTEQLEIAYALRTMQQEIELQARMIELTQELKAALLNKLFTEGLHGESQKETEIGLSPASWDVQKLKNFCDVATSSISYSKLEKLSNETELGKVQVFGVKVSDMNLEGNESKFVTAKLIKFLDKDIAEKKCVPANAITFPKRGAAIATNKKRLTTTWTIFDPNLVGVVTKSGLDTDFLFYWFQNFDLLKITDPGPTPQLNKKDLEPMKIPRPKSIEEQLEIASIFKKIDEKISLIQNKRKYFEELFATLLNELLTGKIRVDGFGIEQEVIKE